jgi:hypothetical protein
MSQRQASFLLFMATLCIVALWNGPSLQGLTSPPGPGQLGEPSRTLLEDPNIWTVPLQLSEGAVDAGNPALAVDALHGTLHLAWEENASIRYAYRDSSDWHLDPYPLPGESPALVVDCDGFPHLVYVDPEGDIQHTLRRSTGWGPPSNISSTSGQSNHPDIALTANHGIHVVWSEKMGEDYRIFHAKSLDNGASWYAMQSIPDALGYSPSLAWAATGRLMVAWQNKAANDGPMRVYSAEYGADLWTQPITVSLGLEGEARDPDLEIDRTGRAHLVWEEETPTGASSIYYAQNATGAWMMPVVLSSGSDDARYPSMDIGPTADINLAWSIGHSLLYRHESQGHWDDPEPVTAEHYDIRRTALVIDSDGVTYVAWSARDETGVWSLFFSQRSPYEVPTTAAPSATATSQSTPAASATPTSPAASRNMLPSFLLDHRFAQPVSRPVDARALLLPAAEPTWVWSSPISISSSSKDSRNVTLAVALDGTLYAVWEEQFNSGTTMLRYSYLQSDTWFTPTLFYAGEEPSLAVAPDGTIHLVYANDFDGDYDIFHTTWLGDKWSGPVNVSETTGASIQPALAVQSDGHPVAVWTETLDGQRSIYYAWLDGGFWNSFRVGASSDGQVPDVAVERDDRVWVSWQVVEDGKSTIYAAEREGNQWKDAQNISAETEADSTKADLVGVSSLGAFLVWQGAKTSGSQVYYSHTMRYVNYWESPTDISQGLGSAQNAAMAVDPTGNIHLAWCEETELLYRRGNTSGATWSSTLSLASQAQRLGPPAIAAASDVELHVAWEQAPSGSERAIYYRAASAPTATPTRTLTPSRTPTPTRTFTPLPYRLGLPLVLKP